MAEPSGAVEGAIHRQGVLEGLGIACAMVCPYCAADIALERRRPQIWVHNGMLDGKIPQRFDCRSAAIREHIFEQVQQATVAGGGTPQ